MKFKWGLLLLFSLMLFLTACQDTADGQVGAKTFNVVKEVTEIEVRSWHGEVYITTIDDKELIEELVHDLENAEINSTANVDWAGPDYKLLFKNGEEVLYELGYVDEEMNFGEGATGRYWEESDQLYKVDIGLPLD
ncbi:hypothetical protein [Planomicrobium sp. Y74]|uniref:hypothetical protein n=1 Tax=Planomicrobium sp. Y74 TaxID=2478977 RepID=UPI000EF44A79|nr:hypothetical protein [Planomicrobium sp. Y74]RLQ91426.1 hypothetical protein D9754_06775 [Planomicrobium sp. Y74]